MRSGELRNAVEIQQVSETPDARGETLKTWAKYADAHAAIYPVENHNAKDEVFDLHGEHNLITHKIVIRFCEGVKASMRVVHGADIYEIRKVTNSNNRDKMMVLSCEERPSR